MNMPNVHAGRLERRVRRVGNETMPRLHGFCSLPLFFIRRNTADTYCAFPALCFQILKTPKRPNISSDSVDGSGIVV